MGKTLLTHRQTTSQLSVRKLPLVIYSLLQKYFVYVFQVKFTTECPAQGNRNYIPVNDLYARNFTDPNGEFQLELSMGHVRTVFDTEFRVPQSLFGHTLPGRHPHASKPTQATKLETTYFSFGGFDWNLALYPHGKELHGKFQRFLMFDRFIS